MNQYLHITLALGGVIGLGLFAFWALQWNREKEIKRMIDRSVDFVEPTALAERDALPEDADGLTLTAPLLGGDRTDEMIPLEDGRLVEPADHPEFPRDGGR